MPQVVRLSEAPRTHLGKDPNLTRDLNGQLWIAWHNYRMKEDRILVRSVQSGRRGPVLEISDQPGINFQPRIACDGHNNIWVVWSAQRENHWCILACSISEGKPGTVICLSKHTEPETFPAITSDAQGQIWVPGALFETDATSFWAAHCTTATGQT